MKKDVVTMKDFKREEIKRNIKNTVTTAATNAMEFVKTYKDEIMIVGPIVVGTSGALIKFANKHINLKKQEDLKQLYCYDRSLGHYWELKRQLTNKEWLEIDTRKKNGERLADILDELKVLK